MRPWLHSCAKLASGLAVWCWLATVASGGTITLRSGLQFEGSHSRVGSLSTNPLDAVTGGGEIEVQQIILIDDNLTRTFVPSKQIRNVVANDPQRERIKITQRVATKGKRIGALGPIIRVGPFDEFGRRVVTLQTGEGPSDVLMGITEITPRYTKVEALQGKINFVWDTRIATSSIPADTLSKIIRKHTDPKNADARLSIVKLYIQSDRIGDARNELESVLRDFPDLAELQRQAKELQQVSVKRLLKEIEFRRDAGQHLLAQRMLEKFPDANVAGETLVKVQELVKDYRDLIEQGQRALKLLEATVAAMPMEASRKRVQPIVEEINTEMNIYTLDRLADFLRLADDDKLTAEQKVALAISGWILGSNSGTENMAVATSLIEVRDLVRRYLRTPRQHERMQILDELKSHEGNTPNYVAKIVAQMKPPIDTDPPEGETPGLYELKIPGLPEQPEIVYHVQLPPEYNPYRRYPCVVTLNGSATTPQLQIDWWAGVYDKRTQLRLGQAARRGYIVIAPVWAREHQRRYEYSAREHSVVLWSLRDACRRFSIDSDRVFLSGHSMGGDAAWDIGLAHPDLWAGVIPIVATSDKYVQRYWENGRRLPMYFVSGQLDGSKLAKNAPDLDRYLQNPGYDCIVVEYQGRGHEHFQDEIQRLFEWMNFQQRNFFPKKFEVHSLRPWDSYFWWLELDNYPSTSMVLPLSWPPASGTRPAKTTASILETNGVHVASSASKVTVWLSPEMVDFEKRIPITVNGKAKTQLVIPSTETLLEDVRTRGDRQHPFWAKFEAGK